MWFLLLTVAVALGGLRDLWLRPLVSEMAAHQLETVTLCLVHIVVIRCFVVRQQIDLHQAIVIGLLWTAMLLLFEFSFFPLVMGIPMVDLSASLDIRSGHLFGLVVLMLLLAPPAFARTRQ